MRVRGKYSSKFLIAIDSIKTEQVGQEVNRTMIPKQDSERS
jgi:hypothetical protein